VQKIKSLMLGKWPKTKHQVNYEGTRNISRNDPDSETNFNRWFLKGGLKSYTPINSMSPFVTDCRVWLWCRLNLIFRSCFSGSKVHATWIGALHEVHKRLFFWRCKKSLLWMEECKRKFLPQWWKGIFFYKNNQLNN